MIVCSCNVITDQDIRQAVSKLNASQPNDMITISQVYKTLGQRPKCGSCLDNAIKIMLSEAALKV
ncbi:MAG: (2Fe-2S)-binding protein [Pseudomonadota bacterium]